MNAGDSEDSLGGAVCYKLRNSGGLFSVHSQKQDRDEGELTFRMMGSDDFADSLSPGIAGSTAGLPTGDSAGGSLPLKEVDAKSSALKALAGIGKVVSKSRRTDAEALLAIKAQRAKDRAEGKPFHRHSRTLSSGSMPLSDSSSATAHMPPSNRGGHRRSHSSIQLPSPSAGLVASVPLTSPYAYANWLAGRSLAELLALQEAVQKEITKKSNNSNIGGGKAVAFPPSSSSPGSGMSSHYSAALLAMLRDQPQRGDNTNPLQQSMNSATSNYAGTFDSIQGYLDPASCCSQSSGRGPVLSQQGSQYSSHTPLITGDSYGNSRSTSPYLETRRNVIPDASAASLSQLDPITPQTDPRDLIGLHLTSLSPGAGSLHSQQSSFSTTPEFSFLSDAPTFTSADLPLPSFLSVPTNAASSSTYSRAAAQANLAQHRPLSTSSVTSNGCGEASGKSATSESQTGDLHSLFSSMHLLNEQPNCSSAPQQGQSQSPAFPSGTRKFQDTIPALHPWL